MDYVALPVARLKLGNTLPIDVWAPDGRLLLRRGQAILSEQQREMLHAHQACMTASDARAWQKSYERLINTLIRRGVDLDTIVQADLPSELVETDYLSGAQVLGGWLDLQEILRGLLYQGEAAINPLPRLAGIESRALELLSSDPDECLFILFQALADISLGYCATHALLSAVVCALTAEKLDMAALTGSSLFRAALVMNIGMAREQDGLARQSSLPTEAQRVLVREHPRKSVELLRLMGVSDEDQLDIVRWHHETDESHGLAHNVMARRLLRLADAFVAKMAARKTRLAMSALGAAKSVFLGATPDTASMGSAMATALGFYPPGTYVQLVNGEKAVVVARGLRANQPQVVSIVNAGGMPVSKYLYRETSNPEFGIRTPINAERIKVKVSLEKVQKARKERTD
jgi:hypothetical protein